MYSDFLFLRFDVVHLVVLAVVVLVTAVGKYLLTEGPGVLWLANNSDN